MREQALLLGPRRSLVGIITESASAAAAAAARLPAVVILNAGIIHRVGPNRMSVQLARSLAEAGRLVLRFDLSGVGDSEGRPDGLQPMDAAMADIREALDSLASLRQADRFILVGLCSGADLAVVYSGSDARVLGVVLIDASIPRTAGYYLRHYGTRLLHLRSWINFATRRHSFWRSVWTKLSLGAQGTELAESLQWVNRRVAGLQQPETRAFLERAYGRAIASDVQMLAVFTAGLEAQHNYPRQLLHAFRSVRFDRQLQLEFFPHADHTFSRESERLKLLELIVSWTQRQVREQLGRAQRTAQSPNANWAPQSSAVRE